MLREERGWNFGKGPTLDPLFEDDDPKLLAFSFFAVADVRGEVTGTGGKGWCPDPVHHKHIARKWTKDLANTHPEYSKDIQNFPSQFK
jgi:hypothetical protein